MKRIMILGGGENQLPLIKSAKELGYYVIVCDMRDQLEGVKLADFHVPINYTQRELVLEAAKEHKIDGITSNSEPAMLSVAYVAEKLGLPGNSVESVETLLSKSKFRQLQKRAGVFAPEHVLVDTVEELLTHAATFHYPIIVKPEASSGTRGTTKLIQYDEAALREAFSVCQAFSRTDRVAMEEYVEMPSLRINNAEIFVLNDDIFWDGVFWEDRSPELPLVPMTEIYPMVIPEEDLKMFQRTIHKIIRNSGATLGQFNLEAFFTLDHQVFVVEINPRQGGNCIPQSVKEHTGVDLTKLLVTTTVNDMSYCEELKTYQREHNFITCQVIIPRKKGIYTGLYVDSDILPYISWIKHVVQPGTAVARGKNAGETVAFVGMRFPSYEIQHKYTDEIERYVYAEIEEGSVESGENADEL